MAKRLFFWVLIATVSLTGTPVPIASDTTPISLQERKRLICEQAREIQYNAFEAEKCRSLSRSIEALDAAIKLFAKADIDRCDVLTDRNVWEQIIATERVTARAYRVVSNKISNQNTKHFFTKIKLAQRALESVRDNQYFICLVNAMKIRNDCVVEAIRTEIVLDEKVAKILLALSDDIIRTSNQAAANFFDGITDHDSSIDLKSRR